MTAFQDTITQYNVIVGDANKALASVAPSATSGVPLVSGGSSANPSFTTAVVAGGGTGATSFTAYSLLCAGTTSTGAMQSVGTGSSGKILRSAGSSALPSWSTATYPATAGSSGNVLTSNGTDWVSSTPSSSSGGMLMIANALQTNPADATTYYYGVPNTTTTAGSTLVRINIAKAITITAFYGSWNITGTASTESVSVYIRLNNTTDTTITTSLNVSGTNGSFNATGLSISCAAGDYIQLKVVTPTWATNPTGLSINGSVAY